MRILIYLIPIVLSIQSCGNGNNDVDTTDKASGESVNDDPISPPVEASEYNACESSYYHSVIGDYSGTAVYYKAGNEIGDSPVTLCDYAMEITIGGRNSYDGSDVSACKLTTTFRAIAKQDIFLPYDDPDAFQCASGQGTLDVVDPHYNATASPETYYDTINLPVVFPVTGPDVPSSGPYAHNDDLIVPYVNLFGGLNPLADGFVMSSSQVGIPNSGGPTMIEVIDFDPLPGTNSSLYSNIQKLR